MSRTKTTGRFASTEEDEDSGEDSVTTGEVVNFVNPSAGSLCELKTDLWGADVWNKIYEIVD